MHDREDSNSRQQLAAELLRVRVAAGLTQQQMAERLGMTYAPGGRRVSTGRAAVSAWEKGRRTPARDQVKVYLDMGADPEILAVLEDPARGAGTLSASSSPENTPESGSFFAAAADVDGPGDQHAVFEPVPARSLWWRRHWRWLATAAVVVVVAAPVVFAVTPPSGGPAVPATTWTETTGTPAHTWADPMQLTGAGMPLGPRQSVQVLCRVRGYVVQDGDPWWYRLASPPWNGRYFATSDAFYNNGAISGPVNTGVVVDEQLPVCDSSR